MRLNNDGPRKKAMELKMLDNRSSAYEQVERLTARIDKLAAEYARTQMARSLMLSAGDVRQARYLGRRMHLLNAELAYLVGLLKQSDEAAPLLAQCEA
jgi:hypothetical protein